MGSISHLPSAFNYDDSTSAVIRPVNDNPMILDMDFQMANFVLT
jgi:hypothetical protein